VLTSVLVSKSTKSRVFIGPLDDDTLRSFLDEVERIVHDPYYKVRQAASFALGALAKEIPEELVPRLVR